MVPATLVLTWVALGGRSLANPKSDILGVKSLSSNTLLAFISLCIIGGLISSWRNARPRATPMQSFTRVFQLNSKLSGFRPALENKFESIDDILIFLKIRQQTELKYWQERGTNIIKKNISENLMIGLIWYITYWHGTGIGQSGAILTSAWAEAYCTEGKCLTRWYQWGKNLLML